MLDIGARLKMARKSKGFSQESLAETIGVSRGVIYNIEKGIAQPQEIVIRAVCAALQINRDWLVYEKGEMDAILFMETCSPLVLEICCSLEKLTEREQIFILDIIKSIQKNKVNVSDSGEAYREECTSLDGNNRNKKMYLL